MLIICSILFICSQISFTKDQCDMFEQEMLYQKMFVAVQVMKYEISLGQLLKRISEDELAAFTMQAVNIGFEISENMRDDQGLKHAEHLANDYKKILSEKVFDLGIGKKTGNQNGRIELDEPKINKMTKAEQIKSFSAIHAAWGHQQLLNTIQELAKECSKKVPMKDFNEFLKQYNAMLKNALK